MKLLFVYLFVYFTPFVYSQETFLYIWNDTLAFTTDPYFLSYNIDATVLPQWNAYNLILDRRFRTLLGAISPAWLRIGGTQGDHNIFTPSDVINRNILTPDTINRNILRPHYTKNRNILTPHDDTINRNILTPPSETINRNILTPHDDTINRNEPNTYNLATFKDFCLLSNDFRLNLTFGLNLLQRDGLNWDPTNSELLMKNIKQINQGCRVNFELGNEPDMYFAQGFVVNESQVATAFTTARKAIDSIEFKQRPLLFGPDVASPLYSGYFLEVLKFMSPSVLDGVTYHHFYDRATIANPAYSYDPRVLDKFIDRATIASKYAQKYQPSAMLILGETADYTDAGVDGISNTYLQGFMFLDSLGISAYLKHSIYFKQSLFGTKYSALLNITNKSTADPMPAFWLTLIYRKLVSNRVLTVTGSTDKNRYIRMYAHCLNGSTNGSVVVYLMNLNTTTQEIKLSNIPLILSPQHWYLLSYIDPGMRGNEILLNGNKLVMSTNTSIPAIKPDIRPASASINFPARHYGFIVFPMANVKPCKDK